MTKPTKRKSVDDQIVKHLEQHTDAMVEALVERVQERSGGELQPDSATLRNLNFGARAGVVCLIQRVASRDSEIDKNLFIAHGRAQQAAGRDLDELLSFYRTGACLLYTSPSP